MLTELQGGDLCLFADKNSQSDHQPLVWTGLTPTLTTDLASAQLFHRYLTYLHRLTSLTCSLLPCFVCRE